MELGSSEKAMPFFAKYGHYVLMSVLLGLLVNLLLRSWRKGERILTKTLSRAPPSSKKPNEGAVPTDEEEEDEPYLPSDLEHVKYEYRRPSEDEVLARSLEFCKIAGGRRTLRFFSSDPLPREIIRNIVRAAGSSPSGAHTEPWTFVVVSNEEVKRQIRRIVEHEEELNYRKRMSRKWTTDLRPLKTTWTKEYITQAPYLILVFKQEYGILPNNKRKVHYYKELSVAIACGILITAIQYAGLVTLTSTPLNCGPALRLLLKRPVNEKLVLLLPVGYPADDATVPDLKRKKLEEILVEIE